MAAVAKQYEFKPDKPRSGFFSKLFLTPTQRRSLLKWTLYALVLVALSLVQDVFFCRFRLYGGTTELVPCAIFLICVLEGAEKGSVFALTASLLYLFSGSAAGYYSVVFITVLAVVVTAFRQGYLQQGFIAALMCVAAAMLVYELLVYSITLFLGQVRPYAITGFLITAGLSLPAVPILYPLCLVISGSKKWESEM